MRILLGELKKIFCDIKSVAALIITIPGEAFNSYSN